MPASNQYSDRLITLRQQETADTKVCTTCETLKPLTEFYRYVGQHKDTYSRCKECQREYNRSRLTKTQDERLKRKYGLSLVEYDGLLSHQYGTCALCGTNDPGHPSGRFVVDHDHDTGVVRGLLCTGCNVGLGYFRDNPTLLLAAIGYLAHAKGDHDGYTCEPVANHAG